MSLQQNYYSLTSLNSNPYTSCSYAVYIEPTTAASLVAGQAKNYDAVLTTGLGIQTNPPSPTHIGNILYIPAKSASDDTLNASTLFRELHVMESVPATPGTVVNVAFPSVQPDKKVEVSLTKQGGMLQVALAGAQNP